MKIRTPLLMIFVLFSFITSGIAQKKANSNSILLNGNRTLDFPNGKHFLIPPDATYAISPGGTKAAVLKWSGALTIFDIHGKATDTFRVTRLDKIAIADDGRFAVYGFYPTQGIARISHLFLYHSDGTVAPSPKERFSVHHMGSYSKTGTFAFLVLCLDTLHVSDNYKLMVFDKDYHMSGSCMIKNWPKYASIVPPEFDEVKHEITILQLVPKIKNNKIVGYDTTILVYGLNAMLKREMKLK